MTEPNKHSDFDEPRNFFGRFARLSPFRWKQRAKITVLAFLMAANSHWAEATEPFKIGIAQWSGYPESIAGFQQGLADNGLIENEHYVLVSGALGADKSIQLAVAEEFKAKAVDLVYSLTTPGTTIMKETVPESTPIVFSIVTYPADSGLIESFEYSGNNLVGTSNYVPLKHYLELLTRLFPDAGNGAVFYRKGEPNSTAQAANLIRLFRRNDINVINVAVTSLEDLEQKAKEIVNNGTSSMQSTEKTKTDFFITTTDTLMQSGGEEVLAKLSLQSGIPILSSNKNGIESGSTFGPVADFYTLGKASGHMAAKILLQGKRPTELVSEVQNEPMFLVNSASLDALGVSISESNPLFERMIFITN